VPLDPEYPEDRLAFMLSDMKPRVILTDARLGAALPAHGAEVIELEATFAALQGEPEGRLPRGELGLDHLAYVIYTSGSTGKPKGAMNAHRGVLNRLLWMQRAYRLTDRDAVVQKTPFSFDVSVWELFWPLMFGARLVIARPSGHKDPAYLAELVVREGVTTMHFVPSMLKAFVEEPRARECQSLERVFTSGEALSPQLADELLSLGTGAELHNLYGPTEAAIDVTAWHCQRGETIVPIGRPVDNVRMYVLDPRGEPTPIGVAGEIFIAGVQVGRGYLNRDELTRERFVPDPFSQDPGARMYKTGDLGRWLPNGALEYKGRTDFQVKIRGFRIELGEIEAALSEHAQIRDVVVVARAAEGRDLSLVAYLVASGEAPTVGDLRAFLKDRLPEHMIPAAFVPLDALPLTASGKVDRKALPAPDMADRLDIGEEFVAPRAGVEEELARIWASVLRIPRVGAHDNFFAVGGDSILSIQIVSRAEAAGIHITPRQLFQHQTVAELAAVAGSEKVVHAEQGVVTGPLPLTPVQRWRLERDNPSRSHDNQSYFLEAREALDPSAMEGALAVVLEHHDALRLRFSRGPSGWEQVLSEPGGPVPMTRVDLSAVAEGERQSAIERAAGEAQASLDVEAGPLLRAVLFEGEPGRLLLVVHHLAVDAISWRILVEDLWSAYGALLRGEAPALPPKTTSYKQWAERLALHAKGAEIAEESAYWLADRGEIRRLPVDRDDGPNTEASARSVVVSLSTEETESLLRKVPEAYRTQINDALLTAFAEALSAFTGGSSVLVDLEGHGREDVFPDVDLTRTVGWFTSVVPMVIRLTSQEPGESLRSVKEQIRAVPDRGFGHGLLRYLRGDEIASRLASAPEAEVSFNYLGQLDQGSSEHASSGAPYRRASLPAGPPRGAETPRRYLLDVMGSVLGGRLHVRFTYSERRHERATIERLADRFASALRAIIAHARDPLAGGYTPSDFPRARLSQAALDRLASRYEKRGIAEIHPLSPMQQGILFHVLHAGDPATYYVELAWTIEGDLDVSAFERAWQEVVDRHESLRTSVVWEGVDSPVAVVESRALLPFSARDLRGLSPEQAAAEVERVSADERRRGFDLARGPLMRITLLRTGDRAWRFVWGSHHIVLDGWSMPILLREALSIYEARVAGRELRLDSAPSYSAYVRHLGTLSPDRREAFWRGYLQGFSAPTPLPGEGATSAEPRSGEHRARLSDEESKALSVFARKHRLTMSTLVQGAWAILLSRYSGERDVLFGSTVSGRSAPVPGIDRMVGLFINTLAVRADVDPDAPAISFLGRLQDQQAEMREHEQSPLAEVKALSSVPRGAPLFESLVVFENQPVEESLKKGSGSLALTAARAVERPPYPLTLQSSFRRSLLVRIGYDANRFDAALVGRMVSHLSTLLLGIARSPEAKIGDLPILPEEEARRVLFERNDTAFAHPTDRLIHEIFEDRAAKAPSAIAVSFEGEECTYRELDERANRLAHALRRRDVGPDTLVGVCMERSIEMMVALYGVLKAGGAYVPLDPEYPRDRLAFMLDDMKPRLILTQARLASVLPEHGAEVIALDADWSKIAEEPATKPERGDLGLDTLAYVIYTSGSTGKPKGAMNAHRGILNRLLWMQHAYRLTEGDVVLQKTPFSFDVSVWELFWPLMFGARLVVAKPGGHREPSYLLDTIAKARVTTMHFVPSMLAVFLDEADAARPASLTRVFASGEALSPALVDRFYAKIPGAKLHNLYGPTEAAVDVTSWATEPGARVVPIGRPVHNTRIYLLDDRMRPVPEGIRGELYIGGVQVGRGYLNRPELTKERFVPDPFDEMPGARLYRTGDVARLLPSGDIEYLGRADFQVKLRGFRIELGEIEAALAGHTSVRDAVVALCDQRLVAYLVCHEGPKPTAPDLRAFLKETLPEYMVPAAFVLLDALPLTASGKVDRKALPAPEEGERAALGASFVAPTGAVEEELCRIWAAVLRVPKVGVHDHFFEIGGDSILSIQIVSRALSAGIHITPRQIFEHPTVAELACVAGTRAVVAAEQGPVTGPVPLTPIERWWIETPREDPHHWNQATFVEIREAVDQGAMERAVARLFDHHDALRLRLSRAEGACRQAISAPSREAPFQVAEPGSSMDAVLREAHASLDLERGPIARVVLFPGEPSRLLFTAHHLAVDGVSWRILLEDLWAAYTQAKRGDEIALPPKTTSWKAWAERLVEHARDPSVTAEAGYWLARPDGVDRRLPVDLDRAENDEGSLRTVLVSLSEAETESLLREAPDAFKTQVNDLLLSALAQALAAWTGGRGALLDVEGHGRDEVWPDVDVTRTVGWLTTVYPLSIELADGAGLGAIIKSVKEQIRAVPQKGLGHGLLRYLREGEPVSADLARLPRSEVLWNYLGQTDLAMPEDAPMRLVQGSSGPLRSPRAARRYLLDVNARVVGGRLHVWFGYSENRHRRETIEALGARFVEALRALIAACLSPEARGHTPSDFADAGLSQDAIDMLVNDVAEDESE
jgi:amino acid adenylation domain-containing protein/non-ribosomal peptide synthase protein (TIGR01720 family)